MSTTRSRIAARGVAAAAVSTFVALLSHVGGGGDLPGTMGILVPLVLSSLVCVALAGRSLSLFRLTLSVAASQFLFHALFILGTPRSASSTMDAAPHHLHGGAQGLDMASTPSAHLAHASVGMWIAHAVACVLTVAALYSAESVLASVAALKRMILARLCVEVPVTRVFGTAAPEAPRYSRVDASVLPIGCHPSVLAHRGPPLLAERR